jgi:hypothetical protein
MDKYKSELARHVITQLGGVSAVARLCGIKQPSVSGWKRHGIPQAREQYLRLLRPEAFKNAQQSQSKYG